MAAAHLPKTVDDVKKIAPSVYGKLFVEFLE
jgi:hypothetical protein